MGVPVRGQQGLELVQQQLELIKTLINKIELCRIELNIHAGLRRKIINIDLICILNTHIISHLQVVASGYSS